MDEHSGIKKVWIHQDNFLAYNFASLQKSHWSLVIGSNCRLTSTIEALKFLTYWHCDKERYRLFRNTTIVLIIKPEVPKILTNLNLSVMIKSSIIIISHNIQWPLRFHDFSSNNNFTQLLSIFKFWFINVIIMTVQIK